VVVNGEKGCIHNAKGNPPRCILMPIFLSICSRCFGVYIISDPTYGIEGLIGYLRWRFFFDKMFKNDPTLFLNGTPNSLQKQIEVLQTLCDESKGKINWHKSCGIWAFKKPKEWSWGKDKNLVWLVTDNVSKYLVFSVNYKMPQKETDNKILQ
jgi:hypothetical protein